MENSPFSPLKFLIVCCVCCFALIEACRADEPFIAIIGNPDLENELDLLTAELSSSDIKLVERSEISKLIREKQIQSSYSQMDWTSFGRLLKADGVLMINLRANYIDVRLVSVESGVIVGVLNEMVTKEARLEWFSTLPSKLITWMSRLEVKREEAVPISLLPFSGEFESRKLREIARTFNTLIPLGLSTQPELFILERSQLKELELDKMLDVTSRQFWTGAWLVSGSINQELGAFELKLSLSRQGEPNAVYTLRDRDIDSLVKKAVGKIGEITEKEISLNDWEPKNEAARFLKTAQWAVKWKLYDQAAVAADSALALHRSPEALKCGFQSYSQLPFHDPNKQWSGHIKVTGFVYYRKLESAASLDAVNQIGRGLALFQEYTKSVKTEPQFNIEGTRVIDRAARVLRAVSKTSVGEIDKSALLDLRQQAKEVSKYLAPRELLDKNRSGRNEIGVPSTFGSDAFELRCMQGNLWEDSLADHFPYIYKSLTEDRESTFIKCLANWVRVGEEYWQHDWSLRGASKSGEDAWHGFSESLMTDDHIRLRFAGAIIKLAIVSGTKPKTDLLDDKELKSIKRAIRIIANDKAKVLSNSQAPEYIHRVVYFAVSRFFPEQRQIYMQAFDGGKLNRLKATDLEKIQREFLQRGLDLATLDPGRNQGWSSVQFLAPRSYETPTNKPENISDQVDGLAVRFGWLPSSIAPPNCKKSQIRLVTQASDGQFWLVSEHEMPEDIRRRNVVKIDLEKDGLSCAEKFSYDIDGELNSYIKNWPQFAVIGETIYYWDGKGIREMNSSGTSRELPLPPMEKPRIYTVGNNLGITAHGGVILLFDPRSNKYRTLANGRRKEPQTILDQPALEIYNLFAFPDGAVGARIQKGNYRWDHQAMNWVLIDEWQSLVAKGSSYDRDRTLRLLQKNWQVAPIAGMFSRSGLIMRDFDQTGVFSGVRIQPSFHYLLNRSVQESKTEGAFSATTHFMTAIGDDLFVLFDEYKKKQFHLSWIPKKPVEAVSAHLKFNPNIIAKLEALKRSKYDRKQNDCWAERVVMIPSRQGILLYGIGGRVLWYIPAEDLDKLGISVR